jgi:hypothetical protein
VLLKRLRETVAAFHARADVLNDVPHYFIGGLIGQSLKGLDHGQTGIDHGGQLACENHLVGQGNLSTAGLALLTDLFLDGDDQKVAVKQRSDGGLLSGGFN